MEIITAAVAPFFKNGFVVWCEDTREAVVIDPGDEVEQLLAAVRQHRLTTTAILLTHAHLDHVTGVGRAKAALGVPTWLHREDLFLYDGAPEQGRMFGIHVDRQPPVDHFYEPGTSLFFGRYTVDVIHTPGHCPGGVCLAIGRSGTPARELFVGDTFFAGGAIGRTDLAGGDYATLIDSIRRILSAFPEDTVVHPGHGPDTTVGGGRRSFPQF